MTQGRHKKETVNLGIKRVGIVGHTDNRKETTSKLKKRMQTIRLNSTGAGVTVLQELLNEWRYPISIDGIFGQKTHETVCLFQRSQHLTADGCVGLKAWLALQDVLKS